MICESECFHCAGRLGLCCSAPWGLSPERAAARLWELGACSVIPSDGEGALRVHQDAPLLQTAESELDFLASHLALKRGSLRFKPCSRFLLFVALGSVWGKCSLGRTADM